MGVVSIASEAVRKLPPQGLLLQTAGECPALGLIMDLGWDFIILVVK